MIVQCKKCETKFRFDEFLIEGEGVWVRCSRCKKVFFLDDPDLEGALFPSYMEKDEEDALPRLQEETREPVKGDVNQVFLRQPKLFMERKEDAPTPLEKESLPEIQPEKREMKPHIDAEEKDISESDIDYLKDDEADGAEAQEKTENNVPEVKETPARSRGKQWLFLFVLLLLLLLAGAFLQFFPDIVNQAAKLTSSTLWTVIETIQGKN